MIEQRTFIFLWGKKSSEALDLFCSSGFWWPLRRGEVPTFLFSPHGIFFFVEMKNSAVLSCWRLFSFPQLLSTPMLSSPPQLSPPGPLARGNGAKQREPKHLPAAAGWPHPCPQPAKRPTSQSPALPATFILFIGQFFN